MKNDTLFTEMQPFAQWWMWLFVAAASLLAGFEAYRQLKIGTSRGKRMGIIGFVVTSALSVSLMYALGATGLETEISPQVFALGSFRFKCRL